MILIRRWALRRLALATAESFGELMPAGRGLSYQRQLRHYAQFTREAAVRALERGEDLSALLGRLHAKSFALGEQVRKRLRLHSRQAVMDAARLLYRMIGIDFHGSSGGEVTVRSCFFSDYYTPPVCRLISALDQGLLAGLAGGGSLSFARRLTEGHPYCEAHFAFQESKT